MANIPDNKADQVDKRAEMRRAALEYHQFPTPGKVAITASKIYEGQRLVIP